MIGAREAEQKGERPNYRSNPEFCKFHFPLNRGKKSLSDSQALIVLLCSIKLAFERRQLLFNAFFQTKFSFYSVKGVKLRFVIKRQKV